MRRFEAFSGVRVLTYVLMSNHFHLLCERFKSVLRNTSTLYSRPIHFLPSYPTCPSSAPLYRANRQVIPVSFLLESTIGYRASRNSGARFRVVLSSDRSRLKLG